MKGGREMKRWVSLLAIVSLVAVSSILIYKEALARPPLCDDCAEYCNSCGGTFLFYIELCWEGQSGHTHCIVDCQGCSGGCICGTTICIL